MMTSKGHFRNQYSTLWLLLALLSLIALLGAGCAGTPEEQAPLVERTEETTTGQADKSDDVSTEEPVAAEPTSCLEGEAHPLAEGIADEFDVDYDTIVDWFCQGRTFDDILLALQTSDMTQVAPEELLGMLDEMTWDEIWDELGVTAPGDSQ